MFQKLFSASRKKELQKTWGLLTAKISDLEEQRVIETRAEERFRLEQIIIQEREKRQQIEHELLQLEAQEDGTGSILNNEHITPNNGISKFWLRINTKIGYFFILLFFGSSFGILGKINQSYKVVEISLQEEIKNRESHIIELQNDVILLFSNFTQIDNDSDKLIDKIMREAPVLGERMLSSSEEGLRVEYLITKYEYATYCFMMSASFETELGKLSDYIEKGIKSGYKVISLVNTRDKQDNQTNDWIMQSRSDEIVRYLLAIIYAIKSKKKSDYSLFPKIEELLSGVSSSYRNDYPFEKEPYLKWYLTQKNKGRNK